MENSDNTRENWRDRIRPRYNRNNNNINTLGWKGLGWIIPDLK